MNDRARVCGGEAASDVQRDVDRVGDRQRPEVHPLSQALTVQALGYEVRNAAVLSNVVDREDIRMIERARCAGFVGEPAESIGIGGDVRQQHFDGHVATKTFVLARQTSPAPPAPSLA